MDTTLSKILGGESLPAELLEMLQEAFDKKVAESREEAEIAIRSEFAARYERDKAALVEAMDLMISDNIQKLEEAKASEIEKLKEARERFEAAATEASSSYRTKINEHVGVSKKFVTEQLSKKLAELNEEKKAFAARRKQLGEAFAKAKLDMQADYAERVKKIDEFVVKQLTRELAELGQDHNALIEARVKVVSEGKKKIAEMQARFIKEAASKVEGFINETLTKEIKQLHEDIERNRQNTFGRRIFEAVAAEFMASHFAEGSEVRKLQKVLEAKNAELAEVSSKLDETARTLEANARKAKLAEDRAIRAKTMGELLSNLRGEKRAVMEQMLGTVKTEQLRASFEKLLPLVLSENVAKKPVERKVLSEKTAPKRVVTGDQRNNRLVVEAQSEEAETDVELQKIVRLAGVTK